jgi:hypothetical protein
MLTFVASKNFTNLTRIGPVVVVCMKVKAMDLISKSASNSLRYVRIVEFSVMIDSEPYFLTNFEEIFFRIFKK